MEDEKGEDGNAQRTERWESGGDSSRGTDRQTDWNEFARTDFNFFVSVSAAGELESLLLYL